MDTPRFILNPRAAALAAVLVALLGPTLARADRTVSEDRGRVRCAPPVRNDARRTQERREREPARRPSCDDRPEEAITLPPAVLLHCLRLLYAMQSICALSGEMLAGMNNAPPLVVKAPPPTKGTPPGKPGVSEEPTPTNQTPEPGTLVGGLVASAFGVAAWWRRRRPEPTPDEAV